jgi:hypothetical protein
MKLLRALIVVYVWCQPVVAESDDVHRQLEIITDRACAGLFWSVNQCGALEVRAAHGQAFLAMARKAAVLEGRRMPLTQDEAISQLSDELRDWLEELGPACEHVEQLSEFAKWHLVNLDLCVRHLRGGN